MTPLRAINWALAALICVLMGSIYRLDGPSDIEAARDVAADVQAAQAQAKAAHHAEIYSQLHQGAKP